MSTPTTIEEITRRLREPFPADRVGWKPQAMTKDRSRAVAVAYIDARDVMDRLDAVVGLAGWRDAYEVLPSGHQVRCALSVRIQGEWITREDVGGESEQDDTGDRMKAAFSDALKRAAVKFGIGRYLYALPARWLDYDERKKQFSPAPSLPAWALPGGSGSPYADALSVPGVFSGAALVTPTPAMTTAANGEHRAATAVANVPASGSELHARLDKKDRILTGEGLCERGELLEHVSLRGLHAGHGADITAWSGPEAVTLAADAVREFEAGARAAAAAAAAPAGDDTLAELSRVLATRGQDVAAMLRHLELKPGARPSVAQARQAMAWLDTLPEVVPARTGRHAQGGRPG